MGTLEQLCTNTFLKFAKLILNPLILLAEIPTKIKVALKCNIIFGGSATNHISSKFYSHSAANIIQCPRHFIGAHFTLFCLKCNFTLFRK